MDGQTMVELCKKHTLYAWSATGAVDPLPVVRAEGVYFWTADGKRYLDFNSQLMSVNIGHGDKRVIAAITKQLEELIFVSPVTATAVRARVGQKLAQLTPGDINTFFFTLGGAEANENAIKAARMYTGRYKILARYRSYHGATNATMMLTGDPRRHPSEPGMPGVIHVMDPEPYNFSFGKTDEEKTANNLTYLEEIIQYEGPKSIAAMFIESVTGTNGILAPPKGYLQGLRALLDKYGILLVCDEVMGGMGRTGKMYGFEHGDIIPDIVTMAKGLTSSYLPLGAMGLRDHVADYFRKNVFYGGLTYNSHPVALACAEAVLDITVEDKLVERSAQMGEVLGAHLRRMKEKHPSVLNVRNTGLFGIVELQKDKAGTPLAPYNGTHPAMGELNAYFKANGLFTFSRWNNFMTNPPLTISHEELQEGFDIIDRALEITDRVVTG